MLTSRLISRSLFPALLLSVGALAAEPEVCLKNAELDLRSSNDISFQAQASRTDYSIAGNLIIRSLLKTDEYRWIGFELNEARLIAASTDQEDLAYAVPFAVKIDSTTGQPLAYRFAAPLDPVDEQKLIAVYVPFHLTPPAAIPSQYQVIETDTIGRVLMDYDWRVDGIKRSRTEYIELTAGNEAMPLQEATVIEDQYQIESMALCGIGFTEGRSEIIVAGEGIRVQSRQSVSLTRTDVPIPSDSWLVSAPLDPEMWQMIPRSEIYPEPERKPLANETQFLKALDQLANRETELDELIDFLFNNGAYLNEIPALLRQRHFEDDFERQLFLALGKEDSSFSHQVLVEMITDGTMSDEQRFRGLMAVKYAEGELDSALVDDLIRFGLNPGSDGDDENLGASSLKILGMIAASTKDPVTAEYITNELGDALYASYDTDNNAALLTALGNAQAQGYEAQYVQYLDTGSEQERGAAAYALGKIDGSSATSHLFDALPGESNPSVQRQILTGLKGKTLTSDQVAVITAGAADSSDSRLRITALEAVEGNQINAETKALLNGMLKKARTKKEARAVMKVLH